MWNFKKNRDNTVAFLEEGNVISYGELEENCNLLVKNVPTRSLVLHLCRNDFASFTGYIAFLNNRIVPIMLQESIKPKVMWEYIENYQPEYIYLPVEYKSNLPAEMEELRQFYGYSLIKTSQSSLTRMHDNLALLLTTSGSTGSPKLVRLSYKNISSNMNSIKTYLEIQATDVTITTLPMNYSYGLSIINSYLAAGASTVLTSKTLVQKEFWYQVDTFGVTSFAGVPYTYEMMSRLKFFSMNFPRLRSLTQAGGRLSSDLQEKFAVWAKKSNKKLYIMYGQTEATARMSYLPPEKALEKKGSIGIPIPGGSFEISGEDELVYSGSNVAMGYANSRQDLQDGNIWKGVLYTGDIAREDEDGFYYITGRKKRFLKIFGNRINLDETEKLINDHFTQSSCVCSGYDDKMYIFITNEKLIKDVQQFVSMRLSLHQTGFKVLSIATIPRNKSGKIQYNELEKLYVGV